MMTRRSKPGAEAAEDLTAGDCRRAAMDLLARREHGRVELERKLAARGFSPELIAPVLEKLAAERLLDESRYAEAFVSGRARRGQGPVRIASELRQRGVAETHSGDALAVAEVDWAALARETREAKFGSAPPADYREWARQARFLQYRGFTMEQIRAALGEAPG
jgi:regulatory protein